MMRSPGLAPPLLAAILSAACARPNDLFLLGLADGDASGSGGATSGATTDTGTSGAPLDCPKIEPAGSRNPVCEVAPTDPLNLAVVDEFADPCDGQTITTKWAQLGAGKQSAVLCDENCGTCDGSTIDLTLDIFDEIVDVTTILPDVGACMRVAYVNTDASGTCRTARLALWSDGDPFPRFAAGIDSLEPLPGTGIRLERSIVWSCECTPEQVLMPEEYPCCPLTLVYSDLIVTPEQGCPIRAVRGGATTIVNGDAKFTFILSNTNGLSKETFCPNGHGMTYWTMIREAN